MGNSSVAAESKSWVAADSAAAVASRDPSWDQVCKALKGIRFGEVRVIVQDGLIVQIERLEKHRIR